MIDQATFLAWLGDEYSIKCLLVEVSYFDTSSLAEKTLYLSNIEYVTNPTDTPANLPYLPVLSGGFDFSGALSFGDSISTTFNWGTVKAYNENGEFDELIHASSGFNYIFKNRRIKLFLGDTSWPREDFYQIFHGIVDDISVETSTDVSLVFRFKDRLQLLNQPVNINTSTNAVRNLGELYKDYHSGTSIPEINSRYQEKDTPLPVCYGECYNVTPVNVDWIVADDTLSGNWYMVHDGPIEGILAVRDNGITLNPSQYTINLASGTFSILTQTYGAVTCDVQGAKFANKKTFTTTSPYTITTGSATPVYTSDMLNLILNIATKNGIIQNRLADSDFDVESIANYILSTDYSNGAGANLVEVCYYGVSSDNIIDIFNQWAASLSSKVFFNTYGKLDIVMFKLPEDIAGDPALTIGLSMIREKSLKVKDLMAPETTSVRLGYAINFSVANELAFMVSSPEKVSLQAQYLEAIVSISGTNTPYYNIPSTPSEVQGTLLIEEVRAYEEATRRAKLASRRSMLIELETTPESYALALGDKVRLQYYRFGLEDVLGVVVGKADNIQLNTYKLTILV